MIDQRDLPTTIPIFPLDSVLLFSRAKLPLNVFEPRYLAMVEDTLKSDSRLIGMVQPRETPKGKSNTSLQHIGCAGRITSFSETDDGRYMITLTGVSRFRVSKVEQGFKPYLQADVDWSSFGADLQDNDLDTAFNRPKFLDLLARYFDTASLSTDWESLENADEEMLVNSISMLCPFDGAEKQALLEAPNLANRRETLVTLMELAVAGDLGEGFLQ